MKKKIVYEDNDYERLLHNAKILENVQESKDNYRKIVRAFLAKAVQDLKNGKIIISSIADIERLIKLDLELQKDDYLL